VDEVQQQYEDQLLSTQYGVEELQCYILATEQYTTVRSGLIDALASHRVHGCLDTIVIDSAHNKIGNTETCPEEEDDQLEVWIMEANEYLSSAAELSIGLPLLVEQATLIYKLRHAMRRNNWSLINSYLKKYNVQSSECEVTAKWTFIATELKHIRVTAQFRDLQARMFDSLADFDVKFVDVDASLFDLSLARDALSEQFVELSQILQYKSELLDVNSSVLSDGFYSQTRLTAVYALYRLLCILCNKDASRAQSNQRSLWYDKTLLYTDTTQLINNRPDPLLFDFLGIANSVYADIPANTVESLPFKIHNQSEIGSGTIFSILIATDWSVFPHNIQDIFDSARNHLIDQYLRCDLSFFCSKGSASLDSAGNILISDLYLQFLSIALNDIQRARDCAEKHDVKDFHFSRVTERWIRCATVIHSCRTALAVDNDTVKLTDVLLECGALTSTHTQYSLSVVKSRELFEIEEELQCFVQYILAHDCEVAVRNLLTYLNTSGLETSETECTSATILTVPEVKTLFDLLSQPITAVLVPSQYHINVLEVAHSLKSALTAALLGIPHRLNQDILMISELCGISSDDSQVMAHLQQDFAKTFDVLSAMCSKTSNSSLQVLTAEQHRQRQIAAATSAELARKLMDLPNSNTSTIAKRLFSSNFVSESVSNGAPVLSTSPTKSSRLNSESLYQQSTSSQSVIDKKRLFELSTRPPQSEILIEETDSVLSDAKLMTGRIVAAYCEMNFFEEERLTLIGHTPSAYDRVHQRLRDKLPIASRNQAPYYCYERLCEISFDITDEYRVVEPLWTMSLAVVIHHLRVSVRDFNDREEEPLVNTTLITLSNELCTFVNSLNLARYVLNEGNEQQSEHRPSFLLISESLCRIHNTQSEEGEGDDQLIARSPSRGRVRTVSNPSVYDDVTCLGRIFLQRNLQQVETACISCDKNKFPIGTVNRTASQSKILLKSFE
jgi:hypothetical protein